MTAADTPDPPPEAVLIRRTREAAGIKTREAARRADISVARWSQVENGRETRDRVVKPVSAPAVTVAHMARAVGLQPDRLEHEGQRADAAEILREILRMEGETPPARESAPQAGSTDPSLRPYLMWVRRDLDLARARHGPGFTGKDAFDPQAEPWAVAIWDAHAFTEAQKIDTIARMRSEVDDAARTGGAAGNGGLTGSDCNHSDTSGSPILNLSH